MIREFLKAYPFMDLAIVAQLIFFGVFLSVIVWVFRKGSNNFYRKLSALPLKEEEN